MERPSALGTLLKIRNEPTLATIRREDMAQGSWTLEETNRLVKLAKAQTPASTISMILGRPREEVDAKMADLALHRPGHASEPEKNMTPPRS